MPTTQTLVDVTEMAVGGMPCHLLLFDLPDQPRHAHVIPVGTVARCADAYPALDSATVLDLVLYERIMPSPDPVSGLDGRLSQLAAAKAEVTLLVPEPALLQPLLAELGAPAALLADKAV